MTRYLTADDVRRAQGREIVLDEATLATPQALDAARELGIELRTGGGAYREPAPDRGPDAEVAQKHLPYLPEPQDEDLGPGMVVTAVGRNRRGVLAEITAELARAGANVHSVSQRVAEGYFHLVLVVELEPGVSFAEAKQCLECLGGPEDYAVRVLHERVFRYMHRI
jgi:ACT domain-containing protein